MRMQREGEKGYPWLFFYVNSSWMTSFLVTLLVIGGSAAFFFWYSRFSDDVSPDSIAGFGYAFAGTTFLVLAAIGYPMQRRARKRRIGQLNAALNWHICFAVLGLALLFMHSFGNFNPRTGTYALYGMIALVISGFIGRLLDRFVPKAMAKQVRKILTAQGQDRIEHILEREQRKLDQNLSVVHTSTGNNQHSFPGIPFVLTKKTKGDVYSASIIPVQPNAQGMQALLPPWDLAYFSQEQMLQESASDVYSSPAREYLSAVRQVQWALRHEQFYRYVIRYWRVLHICLALLTIGLTLWHIEYALQLLLPTIVHR